MSEQQTGQRQAAHMSTKSGNGNWSQPSSHANETPLRELKRSSTPKSAKVERIEQPSIHKSTGPRTAQGKQRSKFNALKHGLLSKAVLLKDESRAEYESLLNGLRENLQPQGKLEEVLVENLATILWRKRRLLQVETAEIAKAEILNVDRALQEKADELDYAQLKGASDGKLTHTSNLNVFRNAIEVLDIVRHCDEGDSQFKKVRAILRMIHGCEEEGATSYGLRQLFIALAKLPMAPQEEKSTEDSVNLSELIRKAISKEMLRLAELHDAAAAVETLKLEHNFATVLVPPQEVSDRLLRYEAHLSREFDRTLSQLERLQRMRMGQPVLPPIKLDISS